MSQNGGRKKLYNKNPYITKKFLWLVFCHKIDPKVKHIGRVTPKWVKNRVLLKSGSVQGGV